MNEPGTPSGGPSIAAATAQISGVTLVARLVGFARWVLLGYAVGTTFLGNVYQTANTIPNIIFELVAGGLLASVLVPTFVREMDAGPRRIGDIASSLANVLLLVSIPIVLIGIFFARPVMSVLLVGVSDPVVKAQQVELGAWFLRFFLPQIPFYLVGIVMQGVLHAHRRFLWPAMGPLLSSLTVIVTYVAFKRLEPDAALETVSRSSLALLAGGTTLGVLVLTLCQLPSVLRLGIRWRPVLLWRDPVVRRAFRAGGWGAGYLGITQLILLVAVMLANRVEGGVVAFQIANAFFELPNAIVGLPLAISLYPSLSDAFARHDDMRFGLLLGNGWRLALFGAMPAAVGLFLLAPTATEVLLGWASDVRPALVSTTLQGLAIGVPAWVLLSTIVCALYARGATARPFALNVAAFAFLLAVGVGVTVSVQPEDASALRLLGVAIAIGWLVAATLGAIFLLRAVRHWSVRDAVASLGANLLRAAAVGAAVWLTVRYLSDVVPAPVTLVAAVAIGSGVVALSALRSRELRGTLAFLGRGVQTQERT